jgi:hypothetical protein
MRRNSSSDNSLIISPGNDDSNNNDSPVSPTNNMNENIAQMEDAGFIEWGDDAGVSSSAVDDVRVCLLCLFSSLYTFLLFDAVRRWVHTCVWRERGRRMDDISIYFSPSIVLVVVCR